MRIGELWSGEFVSQPFYTCKRNRREFPWGYYECLKVFVGLEFKSQLGEVGR